MERLNINGTEKHFPDGLPQTLIELVNILNLNESTVVAEINGRIIPGERFAETELSNGQSIELIRFAGGG